MAQKRQGNVLFEVGGEPVIHEELTPVMSPVFPEQSEMQQTHTSRRRIVTDMVNTDSKRNMLGIAQSLETLNDPASEKGDTAQNLNTYQSQKVITRGPEQDPYAAMSPAKRTAAALEGSPMFTPLEVKFKNMSKFEDSAKKIMRSHKYPTIDVKETGNERADPVALEHNQSNNVLPKVGSLNDIRHY